MSKQEHYITAPEDRVPVTQKAAYAVGMLVNNVQAAALGSMMVILNLGLGMDPALVGTLGAIPRLVDALTDPVVGHISDNTRTRFGRRRPYLFWGAIFSGFTFALMWQLYSGHSQSFYFWFFLIASIAFFLSYAVFSIPFIALGYEMTPDYHERTRLQAIANWLGQIAWITVPWFLAIMNNKAWFNDQVEGARALGIAVGVFIIVGGIVPAIFNRELNVSATLVQTGKIRNSFEHIINFFKLFVITFKCRPFIKLCAATFLVFNGFQLGASFSYYVILYYIYGGDTTKAPILLGWFGTTTSLFTFGIIPLVTWISTKLGKKRTFLITISISLVGYALKWVGYNPDYPYLLLIAAPFVSFGIGSLFTVVSAMVADVCDYDELQTGQRREGMFGAVYWWMVKLGMTAVALLSGFLLNASGFDVAVGNVQPVETLFFLRVFDVGIPMIASVIAILTILTFDITEKKAHEIRLELEKRRGKPAG